MRPVSWMATLGTVVTIWMEMAVNSTLESAAKTCVKTAGKLRDDSTLGFASNSTIQKRRSAVTQFSRSFHASFHGTFHDTFH